MWAHQISIRCLFNDVYSWNGSIEWFSGPYLVSIIALNSPICELPEIWWIHYSTRNHIISIWITHERDSIRHRCEECLAICRFRLAAIGRERQIKQRWWYYIVTSIYCHTPSTANHIMFHNVCWLNYTRNVSLPQYQILNFGSIWIFYMLKAHQRSFKLTPLLKCHQS